MANSIIEMLTCGRSGVVCRAVCFLVARGNPSEEELRAVRALLDAPYRNDRVAANRPLWSVVTAALHIVGVEAYTGDDRLVLDMILMFQQEDNISDMRSCAEYKEIFAGEAHD